MSESRKEIAPAARRVGWKVTAPPVEQWSKRMKWAAEAAAAQWTCTSGEVSPPAEASAVMERVLDIVERAFLIGRQSKPVEPLAALVRLEAVRPQPPPRAAAKVA